jgi:hypothetical protein
MKCFAPGGIRSNAGLCKGFRHGQACRTAYKRRFDRLAARTQGEITPFGEPFVFVRDFFDRPALPSCPALAIGRPSQVHQVAAIDDRSLQSWPGKGSRAEFNVIAPPLS